MSGRHRKSFSWNFFSLLLISGYSILQILRWSILPQFMDIHYHLLTAWGFIQAGGYSSWDFWQYAPVGRPHVYPPFFHIILAFLIKAGMDKIILAKTLTTALPIVFLILFWQFIRRNYTRRLAFFVLVMLGSNFSFYLSLMNHLPATLALIIGILALGELFKNRLVRATLLLALCFYTHIGVSYFFAITFILYGIFNREYRKLGLIVSVAAIILSIPIIFNQLLGLKFISLSGISQRHLCEFKIIDYVLAFFGLIFILRMPKKYLLFLSLFLASLIFLPYPYRFFSAQGYLAVIPLAALSLDLLYEKLKNKKRRLEYLTILIIGLNLLVCPTIIMKMPEAKKGLSYKVFIFDSVFADMLFPSRNNRVTSTTMWLPDIYLPIAGVIRKNSQADEIIYSNFNNVAVCLAGISERATANALFPEIGAAKRFAPILVSRIIIISKDYDPDALRAIVNKFGLIKIGENKLFFLYKNPFAQAKLVKKKAFVSFKLIGLIGFAVMILFLRRKNPL